MKNYPDTPFLGKYTLFDPIVNDSPPL